MIYELHPLCTLFPRMQGAEFDALVADIQANGQREPIILHDDMILDGGNRYRACLAAGIEPQFMRFGGGNLVSYVLSANLHRRHMTAGQQAAIVAAAQDWAKAHVQGGTGANQYSKEQSGNLAGLQTVADRAATSGAGERTQRMADKVAKSDPELAKQVAHGEISLPKAVEQVTGKRPGQKQKQKPAAPQDNTSELDGLREELQEARETLRDLADELTILADIKAGAEAKRLMLLQAENKALKSQLDDYINQNAQLKRQIKMMRRQMGETVNV